MGVDSRASGTRDSAVTALLLCALLGFAWTKADAFLDESPPEFAAVEATPFDVPGGRDHIAVSASEDDDILVRWPNPDGATWSEPELVYRAGSRTLSDMRIEVGGPTLALAATFTLPESHFLNELSAKDVAIDDVTVFVVCRDESCTVSREYAGVPDAPPVVTPNGDRVLLAELDGTRVTWQGGSIAES